MGIGVGLLGLGTVGLGTAEMLLSPAGRHPLLREVEIRRVGVRSLEKPRPVTFAPGVLTTDLRSVVMDPDVAVVIEVLGGLEPARSLILQAIAQGKHVVTANKAVIAKYGEEIYTAANQAGVYVMLEAAVGGGIPVIKPLKQSLGVNRLRQVLGIVNGTTNYILTEMAAAGTDFATVLAEAQRLGYAEADPSADVDGGDAADKLAILASLAFGGRIRRQEVYCEGIRNISAVDLRYADQLGFVIKLLAIAQRPQWDRDELELRVHPTFVPKAHPLASIHGVHNAIVVEGDPVGQVMFSGPGAGAGPTASAVVSDLVTVVATLKTGSAIQQLNPLLGCSHEHYSPTIPMAQITSRFYARFLCEDVPGVIGYLGTAFGHNAVSLESVVQIGFQGHQAEIVVVTHDVREGNFRQALAEIEALEAIASVPAVLRVL